MALKAYKDTIQIKEHYANACYKVYLLNAKKTIAETYAKLANIKEQIKSLKLYSHDETSRIKSQVEYAKFSYDNYAILEQMESLEKTLQFFKRSLEIKNLKLYEQKDCHSVIYEWTKLYADFIAKTDELKKTRKKVAFQNIRKTQELDMEAIEQQFKDFSNYFTYKLRQLESDYKLHTDTEAEYIAHDQEVNYHDKL